MNHWIFNLLLNSAMKGKACSYFWTEDDVWFLMEPGEAGQELRGMREAE